jgi:hypothetical protein
MDDLLNNLLAVALLLLPVVIGVLAAASHLADLAKKRKTATVTSGSRLGEVAPLKPVPRRSG